MIPALSRVAWLKAYRLIPSRFPPINLFEDIADPHDWQAIMSGESKTNPRLSESIGNLDLVPPNRRIGGQGAGYLMAPFVHASTDRPTRFSDGSFGIYYCGDRIEVALAETIYHHENFLRSTAEASGTVSQFRELVGGLDATLHDIRDDPRFAATMSPHQYDGARALGAALRAAGADGIVYRSVRYPDGLAAALFWPDVPARPIQGAHYAYHWNGDRIDHVTRIDGDRKQTLLIA